ncbi:MAG: hypothetical protein O2867_00390 [Bacteroidetes bacterium]|nr:hypothetical protein [Bacteroidota bacterium]
MKSNWTQILVFTILALVLGFVLGRITGGPISHHGDMEHRIIKKHGGDGEHMVWHSEDERDMIFIEGDEEALKVTVEALESSGFEGDTLIDGANISITRDGDELHLEVKKEVKDGDAPGKKVVIEKEVENKD